MSVLGLISIVINSIVFFTSNQSKVKMVRYSELINVKNHLNRILDGKTFMAGASKNEITPHSYLFPMPLLYVLKIRDVNDPIYARALVMSNGKEQFLYIALDMTLVPKAQETLTFISKNTGIPEKNILISATHTHSVSAMSLMDFGFVGNKKLDIWYNQIQQTLLKTVAEAQRNMQPAKYGYGQGISRINVNRDILVKGKSILGSNFERESDKTLRMVRIDDLKGRPIALIVNHATHSVIMNGALQGLGTSLSADLGLTSSKVEKQLGSAVVLWSSGAAGDQNPRIAAQQTLIDQKGKVIHKMLGLDASSVILEYLTDEHARDILSAYKTLQATNTDAPMLTHLKTVEAEMKGDAGKKSYRLQIFTLGNIAFLTVSAEVVSSIGREMMQISPYEQNILMTMTNGYEGYIADDWHYDHNAFEVGDGVNKTKKGSAKKAVLKGFEELFEEMRK